MDSKVSPGTRPKRDCDPNPGDGDVALAHLQPDVQSTRPCHLDRHPIPLTLNTALMPVLTFIAPIGSLGLGLGLGLGLDLGS